MRNCGPALLEETRPSLGTLLMAIVEAATAAAAVETRSRSSSGGGGDSGGGGGDGYGGADAYGYVRNPPEGRKVIGEVTARS